MPRSQPPAAAISTTCKRMMSDGPILTGENPEVDTQARAIYWGTRLWLHAFAVLHKPRWLERKPLLLTGPKITRLPPGKA